MNKTVIEKFDQLEEMSTAAAARIAEAMLSAVQSRGKAAVVLAGGKTPELTYRILAANRRIPWEQVHLFWGDERWLSPEDPESNFFMVKNTLLNSIHLPAQNLHCPVFA
ncbi:MAG: 6-phosphogluconolactonase, partial [Deltaproteobacteria bacterium]